MKEPRARDDGSATSTAAVRPFLGGFLLMPPIVTLFAKGAGVDGLPLIVIYLFGVWAALIVCTALLALRLRPEPPAQAEDDSAPPPLP